MWLIRASRLIGCAMIPLINREALINHNKPITASNIRDGTKPQGLPGPVRLEARALPGGLSGSTGPQPIPGFDQEPSGPARRLGDLSMTALAGWVPH